MVDNKQSIINNIEKNHNIFLEKITEINFYKSIILESKKTRYISLKEQQKMSQTIIVDNQSLENESFHSINFMYKNISGNSTISTGFKEKNIEELLKSLDYQHNKQYQWMLVDAFELYIKFILNSYSHIEKDNKLKYYKIVEKLREKEKSFLDFEKGTFFNKNYKISDDYLFQIEMIKEMRNIIVHQQGDNTSIKCIYKKILKYQKKYLDLDYEDKHKEFISSYFGQKEYRKMICLNELYQNEHSSYDRLAYLLEIIASYTLYIKMHMIRLIKIHPCE